MVQELLNYLYNLQRFGMKLGLEEITKLVQALDNPQNKFKSVHLAGTNGKGITAAFIASIFQEAGYKVGLYTSPHLVKFNERIRINGKEINDTDLVNLVKIIKKKVETNKIQTTFFEFTTALAFLYFAQQQVDYAVIETGLGGRLDATNILKPELSVITNISLDHTKYLGGDKLSIAQEKAEIIKEHSVVVTAEQDQKILRLFKEVCQKKKARLFVVDEQIKFKIADSNLNSGLEGQTFTALNNSFTINLLGKHQFKNAVTALLVAKLLKIPLIKIKGGLSKARWSGRLEIIHNKHLVIVDGAHNVDGCQKLKDFLIQNQFGKNNKKIILILGIAKDKQINKMISLIVPLAEEVILTQGNFKPAALDVLEKEVRKYKKNIIKQNDVKEAIKEALALAKENDLILVTGSLYLVGDVLKYRNIFK